MAFDTEREIVATLVSPSALTTYFTEGTSGSMFADRRYGEIVDWAKSYYSTHGSMTEAPTADVLVAAFPEYSDIVSEAVGGIAPSFLAGGLREMVARRGLQVAIREAGSTIGENALGTALALQEALAGIVRESTSARSRIVFGEDLAKQSSIADNLVNQEHTIGIPYPVAEMNEHTGGMRLGEITIMMAPPSMGKSWFASASALSATAAGWNTYLATLEMDTAVMAQRIELLWANKDGSTVPPLEYTSGLVLPEYRNAMDSARREIAELEGKLVIDSPQARSVSGLFAAARMHGCNFIIIDQLQFITRGRADSRTEQIEQIVNEIALEARTHPSGEKMAVLLLSQMNREGVKNQSGGKIGNMTNLAMSASLEQVADTVWGLGRSDEMKANSLMNIATMKARRFPEIGWQLHWQTKNRAYIGVSRTNGRPDVLSEW